MPADKARKNDKSTLLCARLQTLLGPQKKVYVPHVLGEDAKKEPTSFSTGIWGQNKGPQTGQSWATESLFYFSSLALAPPQRVGHTWSCCKLNQVSSRVSLERCKERWKTQGRGKHTILRPLRIPHPKSHDTFCPRVCCRTSRTRKNHRLSMPTMTGRPGYRTMEMNGGRSAPYLACTPCVHLFCTLFSRGGNRRAFGLPGAGGDRFHCTVEPSPGHIRRRGSNTEEKKRLNPGNNCWVHA